MSDNNLTLNIKQSDGQKFVVQTTQDSTVAQLKEEITKLNEYPADRQRLIFAGKVLKDEEKLSSYNLKNDLTIHLVRSNLNSGASKGATPPTTSNTTATPSQPQQAQQPTANAQADAMANLFGAGFSGFGNQGQGQGQGFSTSGQNAMPNMAGMLNNPMYQQLMTSILSNPELMSSMMRNNPELNRLGLTPEQISTMMSSINPDMMREMLSNPQMQNMMSAMSQGGAGGFPNAFGTTNQTPQNPPATNPMLDFMNQLGANGGGTQPNPFASFMNPTPAQPAAPLPPPEERFQVQLQQLNDMGFYDPAKNIRALLASGGNVHAAVEYLFNNP